MKKKVVFCFAVVLLVGLSCSPKKPSSESSGTVLAKIGEDKVKWSEIKTEIQPQLDLLEHRYHQEIYKTKRAYLERYVAEKILEKEAAQLGIKVPALLQRELSKKIKSPTDQEILAFYNKNQEMLKARFPKDNSKQLMDRVGVGLTQQGQAQAESEYIEDLKKKYSIQILLDEPTFLVKADDDPSKGPKNPTLTLIEFSDFTCTFCSQYAPMVNKVLDDAEFKDKVKLVYRDAPSERNPISFMAAMAAQCAFDQNKFWEYHDMLFENQSNLSPIALKEFAKDLGLNMDEFNKCVDENKYKEEVRKDLLDALKANIQGTPAFYLNGKSISFNYGDQGATDLKEILRQALKNPEKK
ncbi:MAG: thioredoxin domain-containing protein [Deltaproteobacteria bacterium]|nr:thioredoxin domain-containing protein [Deltaproteobacteria bacterium]